MNYEVELIRQPLTTSVQKVKQYSIQVIIYKLPIEVTYMLGVNSSRSGEKNVFEGKKIAAKRRKFFEVFLGVKNSPRSGEKSGPMVLVGGPMVFREKLGGPMVLWTHGFETWNPTLV